MYNAYIIYPMVAQPVLLWCVTLLLPSKVINKVELEGKYIFPISIQEHEMYGMVK